MAETATTPPLDLETDEHVVGQHFRWLTTVFYPCCAELPKSLEPFVNRYIIGYEHTKDGKPHHQIYLEMKSKRTKGGMIKLMKQTCCWEKAGKIQPARGTPAANFAYCSKTGFYATNIPDSQINIQDACRSRDSSAVDFAEVFRTLQDGGSALEVVRSQPEAVRHFSQISALESRLRISRPPPDELEGVCGIFICGLAGVGKSHFANDIGKSTGGMYRKGFSNPRWDGYEFQPTVLFDDVGPSQARRFRQLFKHCADKWPFSVPIIYQGNILIRPRLTLITTQYPFERLFPDIETNTALNRRFYKVAVRIDGAGQRRFSCMFGNEVIFHDLFNFQAWGELEIHLGLRPRPSTEICVPGEKRVRVEEIEEVD